MSDTVFVPDSHAPSFERLANYLKFLSASPSHLGGHRVRMIDGAHEGVISLFEGRPWTIGGGPENDLILIGDGLAEKHLRISPERSLSRGVRVEALEGRVEIEGKVTLQPGEWAELSGPQTISVGRARFELAPVVDGHQVLRGVIFIASVAILAFIAFSIMFSTWNQTSFSLGTLGQRPAIIEQARPSGPVAPVPVAEAGEMARIQLGTLNLAHMVKMTDVAGTLKFDGLVPESFSPSWMAFLQWYDGQRGFPPMVNAVTVTGQDEDIPSIATVWLGEQPMVEFSDGTRGMIGSILAGGWRLVAVNRNAVSFERNGATISVNY